MTTNDIYALIDQIIGDSFDEHHHEARARHSGRRLANQDRPSGHSSRSVQAAVQATRVAAAHPSDRRTTRRLPRRWRTCCPGSGFIPAWAGQPTIPGIQGIFYAVHPRVGGAACSTSQTRAYALPFFPHGSGNEQRMVELPDILAGAVSGRMSAEETALFCSVGLAGTVDLPRFSGEANGLQFAALSN